MPGSDMTAEVEVTDLAGKRLHRFQKQIENTSSREVRLTWTGNGNPESNFHTAAPPPGIYLYRVKLSTGDASTSFSGKMIKILR